MDGDNAVLKSGATVGCCDGTSQDSENTSKPRNYRVCTNADFQQFTEPTRREKMAKSHDAVKECYWRNVFRRQVVYGNSSHKAGS